MTDRKCHPAVGGHHDHQWVDGWLKCTLCGDPVRDDNGDPVSMESIKSQAPKPARFFATDEPDTTGLPLSLNVAPRHCQNGGCDERLDDQQVCPKCGALPRNLPPLEQAVWAAAYAAQFKYLRFHNVLTEQSTFDAVETAWGYVDALREHGGRR